MKFALLALREMCDELNFILKTWWASTHLLAIKSAPGDRRASGLHHSYTRSYTIICGIEFDRRSFSWCVSFNSNHLKLGNSTKLKSILELIYIFVKLNTRMKLNTTLRKSEKKLTLIRESFPAFVESARELFAAQNCPLRRIEAIFHCYHLMVEERELFFCGRKSSTVFVYWQKIANHVNSMIHYNVDG